MSAIATTALPVSHKFTVPVKIADFDEENIYEESLTHCFHTPFITLCGVPWRWSIYQVRNNYRQDPPLAIAFRCGADARSVFMMRVRQKWTLFHPTDVTLNCSKETIETVENNEKLFINSTHMPSVKNLEESNYYDEDEGVINMEFELEVIQATSCALPAPKFIKEIEYHDVCLKVRENEFWVSSNIIKARCNHSRALLPRKKNTNVVRVFRVSSKDLREFLKLLYLYQDDVTANNIDSLLSLSTRFGSPECLYMLEKFIFRTTQLQILDKILLGEKYRLNNVLSVYSQAATSKEKFRHYEARNDFGLLSASLRAEMRANSEMAVGEPYDASLQIDWLADFPGSLSKNFYARAVPFRLRIRRKVLQGVRGFFVEFDCLVTGCEYFMAVIAVRVEVLNGGRVISELSARKFLDVHCYGKSVFIPEERDREGWHPPARVRVGFRLDDFRKQITRFHSHVFKASTSPHWNAILCLNGEHYHVNKEVLASSSPTFARMFAGSYKKKQSKYIVPQRVSNRVFEEGLQHLYQPSRPIHNDDEFFAVCDFLKVISSHKIMEDLDLHTLLDDQPDDAKIIRAREYLFQNSLLSLSRRNGVAGIAEVGREVAGMLMRPPPEDDNDVIVLPPPAPQDRVFPIRPFEIEIQQQARGQPEIIAMRGLIDQLMAEQQRIQEAAFRFPHVENAAGLVEDVRRLDERKEWIMDRLREIDPRNVLDPQVLEMLHAQNILNELVPAQLRGVRPAFVAALADAVHARVQAIQQGQNVAQQPEPMAQNEAANPNEMEQENHLLPEDLVQQFQEAVRNHREFFQE